MTIDFRSVKCDNEGHQAPLISVIDKSLNQNNKIYVISIRFIPNSISVDLLCFGVAERRKERSFGEYTLKLIIRYFKLFVHNV